MVFLRDTDPHNAYSPPRKTRRTSEEATTSKVTLDNSRVSVPDKDAPQSASPTSVSGKAAGKRKADDDPPESLLIRLAGPSTNKAGLKRDPEEVRRIMYEASKGGNYYKNELRKDEELTAQIQASLRKLEEEITIRGGDLTSEERRADKLLAELEQKRDTTQCIAVVDCDAFYASVEELHNPELKGVAFGVGEGVLTTASYEARKFGCRSAMPGYVAKKLCPHLIFVKPDFSRYGEASKKVMGVLARYDPNLAPASLDEAYMNLTPYVKRTGLTPELAVHQMREEVLQETGLTVSAGCGPNTMLAKIAADVNKPNGQCIIEPTGEAARAFMADLSVRKIPGIGRVTERWLEALGVVKCKDIYAYRGKLMLAKGEGRGEGGAVGLLKAYLGLGNTVVEKGKREDRKGVGHETTFGTLWRPKDLDNKLREIADSLGEDLTRLKYAGKTITLKLKLETYEVLSRSKTIETGMLFTNADQLYKYGKQLLDHEAAARAKAYDEGKPFKGKGRDLRLRLMGLKVSNLVDESEEAAEKKKGAGSLHTWVAKAKASRKQHGQAGPLLKSSSDVPIDLTLLGDSDPEDEAGYSEIFLEAAPCSNCHQTFPFAKDVYNEHVKTCLQPKTEAIDLSLMSSQEAELKPVLSSIIRANGQVGQKPRPPKKTRKEREGSTSANSILITNVATSSPPPQKPTKDAFSTLMKHTKRTKRA